MRAYLVANALWEASLGALKTFVFLFITVGLGHSQSAAAGIVGGVALLILPAAVVSGSLADRYGRLRAMVWVAAALRLRPARPGVHRLDRDPPPGHGHRGLRRRPRDDAALRAAAAAHAPRGATGRSPASTASAAGSAPRSGRCSRGSPSRCSTARSGRRRATRRCGSSAAATILLSIPFLQVLARRAGDRIDPTQI